MNNIFSFLLATTMIVAGCGQPNEAVSELQASTQEECEISKELTVRPGSEFPINDGGIYRVASATAKAKCYLGGFGWFIQSWDLSFNVEVANLAFEKRFVFEVPGTSFDYQRVVLDPNIVRFDGQAADGYDQFAFKQNLLSLKPVKLSVIMPAVFNATPNIGNPIPGWTGPTYGLTLEP